MTEVTADSALEPSNPDPDERPEWLPANFNDPADFRKSYDHAQSELTKAKQEAAASRQAAENYEALLTQQQEQRQQATQQDSIEAWDSAIAQAYEEGDFQRARGLERQLRNAETQAIFQAFQQSQAQNQQAPTTDPILERFALDSTLGAKYPDWEDYRDRVIDNASSAAPDWKSLAPSQKAELAEYVYARMKINDINDGVAPATTAAQQMETQRQAKLAAQTLQGANGRPAPQQVSKQEELMGVKVTNYRDLFS